MRGSGLGEVRRDSSPLYDWDIPPGRLSRGEAVTLSNVTASPLEQIPLQGYLSPRQGSRKGIPPIGANFSDEKVMNRPAKLGEDKPSPLLCYDGSAGGARPEEGRR